MKKFNQFRQAVYFLDNDWKKVKVAYKERGGNPLYWLSCACAGLFAGGLSVAWYLHILFYLFISPPPTIFLNALFIELDKGKSWARWRFPAPSALGDSIAHQPTSHAWRPVAVFTLFGTIVYGLFSFYLLTCVLKGCMKVGLRFFWIPIHPMKIGATLMNSFLFNVRPRAAACV